MNITNTLATVFTLLLFVFLVVSMYEQVNIEFFQQFKGAIFAGSMFVVLAILGLPYMQYDIAHRVPSFTFVSTAIGILTVLCAIFVYILNWPFDTFVAYISTFVIFVTMLGRITGGGESDTFPAFAKEMLTFVLVGSVIYGTSLGAGMVVERNLIPVEFLNTVLVWYAKFAPVALGGMLVYAIYKTIRGLIEYRVQSKVPCPAPIPAGATQRFEGFQGAGAAGTTATAATKTNTLLRQMEAAIRRAEYTIDSLVEQTDSTCAIIKEVEQGYVGAKSGVTDEAEYQLPAEEQERRKQSRQWRAMKAFATNRGIYAATRNTKPLECFQNPNTDATDATEYEISLRELCVQLHSLLENTETLAQIKKIQQMQADLDFADRQLNKVETFQNPPTTAPTPTQIYSTLRGAALETAAKDLLAKEGELYASVTGLQTKIKDVRARMSKTYQKVNMVATGDYSVPK